MLSSGVSEQQTGEAGDDDAVAVISLPGGAAGAAKLSDSISLTACQPAETPEPLHVEQPQPTSAQDGAPTTAQLGGRSTPEELQDAGTSQPSTPRSWRRRVFHGRQQQEQQPVLPPGCLVLDGEALLWQEYEEPTGPCQEPLLFGSRSSRLQGHKALSMRTSSSSPNLVLLADSSGDGALEDGQQQQQTHQPVQQQAGCGLLPMHSSQSCDSLLSLCQPGGSALAATYPLGPAGGCVGSTAAKSRLGRPTSEGTPRQQQQQQQSTADSSMTGTPAASITTDCVQQSVHGTSPQQEMLQQQQLRPVAVGCSSGGGGGGCDNGPGVSSWAFSRCNSGLSLGSEALLGRRLLLHTVTFNMNGKLPSSLPPELLGQLAAGGDGGQMEGSVSVEGDTAAPDLLVIATQENSYISEWEKLLASALAPGGYECLAGHSLRAIHLVLFAGRRFRRQVVAIRGSAVATGIGNLVGNKGAVALSIELLDLKLLFISSHLAAHGDQVQQRNADYQRIRAGLFASGPSTPRSATLGSSNGSPRARRTNTQHRSTLSAPTRNSKERCVGGDGDSGEGDSGVLSMRGGSSPWAGFLCSNRVVDASGLPGYEAEGYADADSPAAAAHKTVSWWGGSELSGGSSPSCSSPLLSITPSGPSESQPDTPTAAAAGGRVVGFSSPLTRLRVASCPAMEQHITTQQQRHTPLYTAAAGDDGGGSCSVPPDGSSSGRSGDGGVSAAASSPVCATSGLSASAAAGLSFSGSFLRSLRSSQQQQGSLKAAAPGRCVDVLEAHDLVLWLGDLNYRINGNSKAVRHLMRSRLHEVLHANDQLRLQQKSGAVFQGFQEGSIRFPPTFKFVPGSSAYSDKRVPSWTDRILWKVRSSPSQQQQLPWTSGVDSGVLGSSTPPSVTQLYYTSVPQVISSDHKPVVAGFEVAAAAGEEEDSSNGDDGGGSSSAAHSCCCVMM